MFLKPGFLTLSLAAAALAAGCGGGDGIAADELPDEFERTLCEQQVECGAYPDVATCREVLFTAETDLPQLLALLDAGRLDYDEAKAQECLDLYTGINQTCTWFEDFDQVLADIERVCGDVFTGDVAVGGSCLVDEECAGDAECNVADCQQQCCTGTCAEVVTVPDVEIGGDCTDPEAECVSGAYCNTNNVCAELVPVGGACEGFGACVAGSVCDLDFQTNTGTCVDLPAEGETCDPELFFGIVTCERVDNWCDPTDMVCKKKLEVGATCDAEIGGCVDYAYCNAGTCAQLPGAGEACDAELGPDCLGELECVDLVCTAPMGDPICT